jgi:tetratricopeptide (TPR) repeat protein
MNIKILWVFTLLSLLFFAVPGYSLNAVAFYNEGNKSYSSGDFDKALEMYRKVLDSGVESPELFYNTGNAFFKKGQIGMARYYWEKALRLKPGDDDVKHNIEFLRMHKLQDKFSTANEGNMFVYIYRSVNLRTWYQLFIVTYALCCIFLAVRMVSSKDGVRFLALTLFITFLIGAAYSGTNMYLKNRYESGSSRGVIVAHEIPVKSEPDDDLGTDLFTLHEGTMVRMLETRGDWYKIVAGEKLIGWIRKKDSKVI